MAELKESVPGMFDHFDTDADLYRAIADKSIYRKFDINKAEREYYEQQEENERHRQEQGISDEDYSRVQGEIEADIDAETHDRGNEASVERESAWREGEPLSEEAKFMWTAFDGMTEAERPSLFLMIFWSVVI